MINGKRYAWEDKTISLPHGTLVDVEDMTYDDKSNATAIYGRGNTPVGYGHGKYEGTWKATVLREEYNRLLQHAQKLGKTIYKLRPFPISVAYANDDQGKTVDRLPDCIITERKFGSAQGDTSEKVELSGIFLSPLETNGKPA